MDWIFNLYTTNPTAHAIAIISLVCVAGMGVGSIKFRGIKLGTSGVLFAALLAGHLSKPVDHHTLEFVKEFGLILFVFCIGLQLGPGFFASFRQAGLRLNVLATAIVLMGAMIAVGIGWMLGFDGAAILGVFSGATTNTPSLGAGQQTLLTYPNISPERAALPALAYAVTYPLGIVGIISSLLALKSLFRIDVGQEVSSYLNSEKSNVTPLERRTLVVDNPNLADVILDDVPGLVESGVVVSRIRHSGASEVKAATGESVLGLGDSLLVVGTARGLNHFQRVIGKATNENLLTDTGAVTYRRVIVTHSNVLGSTVDDLNLDLKFGVVATRVTRGGLEMTAIPDLQLQFGDIMQLVGPSEAIDKAAAYLGNSLAALNETHFLPFFAGISVGIALGTLPIACPGLPQPLRLGLAGGPLIVAILVGRLGRIGRLVWHMPHNANLAFREFGIALFFASVGLLAGPTFFSAACSFRGLQWLMVGLFVTVIPLLSAGMFARKVWGTNYVILSGLLAGSMTDPPALAFANSMCDTEAPAVSYATVFPLTMLLRIMSAQVMAVILCGSHP